MTQMYCNPFIDPGEADEFDRHSSISAWCPINQHVPNGQKQQRYGILP